ncbi:MAG: ornithine--oxo-acid transaminase, partial [Thermoplasmata archaeon]|nr:ornithine--oxo-acid transaminase [Thermoplasmata archaeon]
YGAHNYHPIPVVISKAKGIWVWDPEGRKYMDMLSSYSALNQGHCHPKINQAMIDQMERVALTSRAFYNDKLGPFLKLLTEVSGMDVALPMNTGAEAVETGIKLARKWGYEVKGIPDDKAEIIVCEDNFHGRTTTIVGFSSDAGSRDGFGPFTPGFKMIPYNNLAALEAAITPNTAAFLVEPIQGEAGVIVPDDGYLKEVRRICSENNILLIVDEIQTGFCRTGKMFCFQHDGIKPDIVLVGKALGGGLMPVSGAIGSKEVMDVMKPGNHGSTFGGNPLACAVGTAALEVLTDEKLDVAAREMGEYFMNQLKGMNSQKLCDVRGKGLLIAIQLTPEAGPARQYTEALKSNGLLAKETHDSTIRFAPPLVISRDEIDQAMEIIRKILG